MCSGQRSKAFELTTTTAQLQEEEINSLEIRNTCKAAFSNSSCAVCGVGGTKVYLYGYLNFMIKIGVFRPGGN